MLKRSVLYLRRKYKRSILLFLLLFVISFSLLVGVIVWSSIGAVTREVQGRLGTSFNIKMRSGFTGEMQTVQKKDGGTQEVYCGPRANDDLAAAVMQVDGVTDYNAEMFTPAYADDLQLIEGSWNAGLQEELERQEQYPEEMAKQRGDQLGVDDYRFWSHITYLYANSCTERFQYFRTGAFTLVEGRHIQPEDIHKALISEELAAQNGLAVGDKIVLSSRQGQWELSPEDPMTEFGAVEFEITGIFHVNGYQPINRFVDESDITYNWILTDLPGCIEYGAAYYRAIYEDYISDPYYSNLTFFVDDPARLDEIIHEVQALDCYDNSLFEISPDDTMYQSTVDPLHSIRNLVAGLVGAIVVGCMIILMIVFTMWVRSRRQEVAIYLSLGFGKAKILGQFVLEAGMVAVITLALALPAGIPVANTVGNRLLASTVAAAQPEEKEYTEEELYNAAMSGTMSEMYAFDSGSYGGPEQIDFTFDFAGLLVLVALELLMIVAAIGKGGSFIFRLQPRQILTTLS